MRRVQVVTDKPYEVMIQRGLLAKLADYLIPYRDRALFLLTDDQVDELYGQTVFKQLGQAGYKISRLVVPAGEGSKSMETFSLVLENMAGQKLHRDGILIALGGGVVGDLGGFCAATYLRGIDFIQIPTTLLAAVDSSVGGKTGINLKAGKNLAGAFHQPCAVMMDPTVLQTLSATTWADGVAETLKYGILFDEALFDRVAKGIRPDAEDLENIIAQSVQHKANLVQTDEHDKGQRQLLNLGHTFGHGIERASHYTVSHGQAVAIGTALMARACVKRGICSAATAQAVEQALLKNGLPIRTDLPMGAIGEAAQQDKKAQGSDLSLIVIEKIGQCRLHKIKLTELNGWLEDSR